MAQSISVLQPPGTGKTLQTRPNFKGMLRAKLPELCAVGALARWLVVRIALQSESIPEPRSKRWKQFYLWPGRQGELQHAWDLLLSACKLCYSVLQPCRRWQQRSESG